MRKKVLAPRAVAAALGVAALGVAPVARAAAQPCSSYPNAVYVTGASVAKPLVQALATAVAPLNISIIYQNPDSCLGLQDLLTPQPSTESGISTLYLNPNGTTAACTLSTTSPQTPDIAVSEVYASTCGYEPDSGISTSGTVDVHGPINAMVFAVPGGTGGTGSSATSISAEAAYVVFGFDATTSIVPQWNQPADIFVREQTSGSEAMIGVAIGLPPSKWANAATDSASPQQESTSTKMTTAIAGVTSDPSAAIGVLGAENVYSYNAGAPTVPLNILAYQQTGQACGYYPGSANGTLDELNVRQGRYAIWGPIHIFAHVDGSGNPTSANGQPSAVAAVLNYFIATGESPDTTPLYSIGSFAADAGADSGAFGTDGGVTVSTAAKQAFIAAEAKPGFVVPWCAMEVLRTGEMGPEASYQSPEPCSCFFEETVQGAPVSGHTCTPCESNADCSETSTPTCRYGFCEVQ